MRYQNQLRGLAPIADPPSAPTNEPIRNEPFRVVHLIKATGLAGAERHLLTLLEGLRSRGVDARLIVLTEPGRPVEEFFTAALVRGIPTIRCAILNDADPLLWMRLARHLRRLRPDILHTHLVHADLHGHVAARAAGIRCVVSTRHNDDAFRRRAIWRRIHRHLWSRLAGGIAVSESVAEFSRSVEGAPADRLAVVPHGLDVPDHRTERAAIRAELGIPLDELVVGLVGRLTRQKGFDLALEAAASLVDEIPSIRIVVIGDGPLRGALEGQAVSLGIEERVHFLGWQPNAARHMACLDVLLVPSRWEGFGLVVLEAMSQETLVVAAPVGAIPEILTDGVTGLLAASASVDSLRDRLRTALTDPAERARVARAGREKFLTRFSPSRMVDDTLEFYARLNVRY